MSITTWSYERVEMASNYKSLKIIVTLSDVRVMVGNAVLGLKSLQMNRRRLTLFLHQWVSDLFYVYFSVGANARGPCNALSYSIHTSRSISTRGTTTSELRLGQRLRPALVEG